MIARLGVIERRERMQEATFGTVDAFAFDEALGAAQPTGSRPGFTGHCQHGAEPAGTPGGWQRLARIEMSTVCPAHGSGEVLIASGEVRRPGEQPQVVSVEWLDFVGLGQGVEGCDPQSPPVVVAAAFP